MGGAWGQPAPRGSLGNSWKGDVKAPGSHGGVRRPHQVRSPMKGRLLDLYRAKGCPGLCFLKSACEFLEKKKIETKHLQGQASHFLSNSYKKILLKESVLKWSYVRSLVGVRNASLPPHTHYTLKEDTKCELGHGAGEPFLLLMGMQNGCNYFGKVCLHYKVMHLSVPAIPLLGIYLGIKMCLYVNFHSVIF